MHHPEYKYKNQPEKAASPPSKKTPRTKPPAEVFPNPSPADSTITGAGQIVETPPAVKRKRGGRMAKKEGSTRGSHRGGKC